MKNILAKNRSMADMLREVASSPISPTEKKVAEKTKEIEEEKEGNTTRKPKKRKIDQIENTSDLVNRLMEYKIEGKTNRITYIISEKSIGFLKILKSETGVPVTELINFFLEDAMQNNKIEIDKLIKEHIKNLKL